MTQITQCNRNKYTVSSPTYVTHDGTRHGIPSWSTAGQISGYTIYIHINSANKHFLDNCTYLYKIYHVVKYSNEDFLRKYIM